MVETANLQFAARDRLVDREWDAETKRWDRPDIDRDTLRRLNERRTLDGITRVIVHVGLLVATGWLTVVAGREHILLAVIPFLAFSWLVGFLNGIEHDMRHKTVFPRRFDRLSDVIYFLIHALWKAGSRNQRVSHVIHHRYTMARGVDPEPAFPEDLTAKWFRQELRSMAFTVITLGVPGFFRQMWRLIQRTRGRLHPRRESFDEDG